MIIGINALYLLPGRVGGSETYLRNLLGGLASIGQENEFIIFINRESAGEIGIPAKNFRIVLCPVRATSRPLRILWEQFILPLQIKHLRIDVLLSAGMTAPVLCPAASIVMLFDLQHINQPGNFPWYYLPFLRSIIYASARSADGVLTISRQVKSDITRSYRIPEDRIAVTHLAVDHALFSLQGSPGASDVKARYGLPERFILYAASSLPHKNHERLFLAFQHVVKKVPGMKLVLIGARDKGADALGSKVVNLGLSRDVILLGWLPFEDVPAIYRASEAFIYPTLHEGFGLPLIEAMACGVPVACSGIEPLREIAGEAALFFDPFSPDEIAAAIIKAVTDRPNRQDLIRKGLARANEFTWERTARKTLDFIARIAAEKKG
jgi:glycosyltransferase involved in cell wall biosynthesis